MVYRDLLVDPPRISPPYQRLTSKGPSLYQKLRAKLQGYERFRNPDEEEDEEYEDAFSGPSDGPIYQPTVKYPPNWKHL